MVKETFLFAGLLAVTSFSTEPIYADQMPVSCLVHEESSKNIRLIDFSVVRTLRELEDCALQLAKEKRDANYILSWMEVNGFAVSEPSLIPENVMRTGYNQSGNGVRLNGFIPKGEIPLRLGPIDRFIVYSLSLAIVMNQYGEPMEAQATYTRK